MSDEQRKAIMARLGGGGGGAARGYTGGARGGRRGPERNPTPMYVTPEGHARAVREAQIGIQSDITPFDLLASTALESGLDGINQAQMNTDNKWIDAALGMAALGLFAAGVKNARSQQALAKHVSAQKAVDNVFEQMGRDAARFDSMLKGTPSSVGEDVYRTYDQLAERVTRARGYPPSAAEANRWLDKVAPKVSPTSPVRNPTVVEDVKAFRAATLRTTGVAATDNDVATYLLKKHPESYTPPKNYIPPKSSAGDAFRSEAAKTMGSQQAQYLDYARQADMEAVAPRIVKDPWQSTKEVISRIDMDKELAYRAQTHTPSRPSVYDFVTDEPEFYRWYEYGGKPRPKPLTDAELKAVMGNKELHLNTPLTPGLRLIKNAMRETNDFIANAGRMTEEQRRAMFAGGGGRGPARRSSSASIGRIKGSTQNFDASYNGTKKSPIQKYLERMNIAPPATNASKPKTVSTTKQVKPPGVLQDMSPSFNGSGPKDRFGNPLKTLSPITLLSSATKEVRSSTTGSTSKPAYTPPNEKGVGTRDKDQPYVPGQPRYDERGQPIWGPKPGEPGFIDFDKWREGANPRGPGVPVSQPGKNK